MKNHETMFKMQDVLADEKLEVTLSMLKILSLGKREIEEGKFKDAEDVFAQLK